MIVTTTNNNQSQALKLVRLQTSFRCYFLLLFHYLREHLQRAKKTTFYTLFQNTGLLLICVRTAATLFSFFTLLS